MLRLKCYSLNAKCVWRLVCISGSVLLVLGTTSFGIGMKLMEFAEKPDITPVFAGLPMMVCGFLGLASALCKKGWLITCYGIMCGIISMLSIHMNYRFMGKELPTLPVYRSQCLNKPNFQYHCEKYYGTVMLCSVAVLMLPCVFAAFLSCVAAKRTLKTKNVHIFWFTCSKINPSSPTTHSDKRQRQQTHPVALLSYKNTSSKDYKLPETKPAEYVPRIPNFTDIAGNPDSPGYQASMTYEIENQVSQLKNFKPDDLSKNVNVRKKNYGLISQDNEQDFSLVDSDLLREQDIESVQRSTRKEYSGAPGAAISEADLRLLDQDYLNQRSWFHDEEDGKYYDRAAEEWIHKLVDNRRDSRSRLYGVSDEEDLEDDQISKQSLSSDRKGTSTIITLLEQTSSDGEISRHSEDQNVGFSNIIALPGKIFSHSENELNDLETGKFTTNEKGLLFARKRKLGVSTDLSDNEQEEFQDKRNNDNNPLQNSQSETMESDIQSETMESDSQSETMESDSQSETMESDSQSETMESDSQSESSGKDSQIDFTKEDSQSKTSVNRSQSSSSENYSELHSLEYNLAEVPNYVTEQPMSSIEDLRKKDLTPQGIVTPIGQKYPTGSLHFEFEKTAPPEQHAQRNWVEFDDETEDRKKKISGKNDNEGI